MRTRINRTGKVVPVRWKDESFECPVSARPEMLASGAATGEKTVKVNHPFGTYGSRVLNPTLKRRASCGRRFGTSRWTRGFTLIEILVVIAIIGILAALLLPVLAALKRKHQIAISKIEMQTIQAAIQGYYTAYGRFPLPNRAITGDFTFGPSGIGSTAGGYSANNSELMVVLMDTPTLSNTNHVLNPRNTPFLTPLRRGGTTNDAGLGPDWVYRDPWGNAYVITIDYNYNNRLQDAFYGLAPVSADPANAAAGLNGLSRGASGSGYELEGQVMIWSLGPDGKASAAFNAVSDVNKDNVLSWTK